MAFKVDENLLSIQAKDFLNNSKCKAKAVRRAIEFFVTYRASISGGEINIEHIENINEKLDFIIHKLDSRPLAPVTSINERVDISLDTITKDKTVVVLPDVEVQKIPPMVENISHNISVKAKEDDEELLRQELLRLAMSSITNVVGN